MKNLKSNVLAACVAGVLSFSASAQSSGRSDLVLAALDAGKSSYVSGELLVQFRAGTTEAGKTAVRRGLGAQHVETVRRGSDGDLEVMRLPIGVSVATAVRGLEGDAAVAFAEPNWIYTTQLSSNDPYYTNGSLWGMYGAATSPANQFGSGAGAVRSNNCSNVLVGIIDEGYMYTHTDLAANAYKNPGEVAGNARDDDGNGLVDDVYGWDFAGNNSSVFDGTGDDHGTHVAGTIGGVGNNGTGVSGVCHSVKLMGAKFLGSTGGTTANAIKAVDYFTDLKTRHGLNGTNGRPNLVATNNSWGGGGFSQGLADAIERANATGILFVAAAGNSTYDCDSGSACYPAEYTNANIIGVASITNTGAMSSFSSYGRTTIDICAPGSGIWSTVPASSKGKVISSYASYNGTSMATPHVAGAAALYSSLNPSASAAQVKSGLMSSATATASCNGRVVSNGRLNVSGF